MSLSETTIWTIIVALAIGTFLIRFSFLGLIGTRTMPEWVLRHLRYTSVAVMPAIVAPLVLWPVGTDGVFDAPRMIAAVVVLGLGIATRNVIAAVILGLASLYLSAYLFG